MSQQQTSESFSVDIVALFEKDNLSSLVSTGLKLYERLQKTCFQCMKTRGCSLVQPVIGMQLLLLLNLNES